MAETESITVAEVSDGPCGSGDPGRAVDLPVVELLTGRGFITGKSGSGKSNTASVVVEKLLDNGFGMLIVDIDGEYYGLKEEYEILHAGADDECDIQVTVEHAEKIASLALEQNVPIILDVSSFLDEEEAQELLTEVSKRLFAKAKKLKQPFLMLVEEVHEWIPQKGSAGECGKMLIKISKRGRKHGLGIVGISQRPADVKKDFITQCDWLVWHRLTWNNDTNVVRRVLDGDYATEVEDLDDGEAFMMTDWSERVRRVQFHRKKTFDAGATPGLDDFERPDLKSVSDDLVSELESISEEEQQREDRIAELRETLDERNSRIAELETELQDARDMQRMAEQFTQALVEHVRDANPGRTEQERMRERRHGTSGSAASAPSTNGTEPADATSGDGTADAQSSFDGEWSTDDEWDTDGEAIARIVPEEQTRDDEVYDTAAMSWPGDEDRREEPSSTESAERADEESTESDSGDAERGNSGGSNGGFRFPAGGGDPFGEAGAAGDGSRGSAADASGESTADGPWESTADASTDAGSTTGAGSVSAGATRGFDGIEENPLGDRAANAFESGTSTAIDEADVGEAGDFARELADDLRGLDAETRQMLQYYRDHGPGTPMDALFAAGGADDRTTAYARNRHLRVRGLVEHVGRGRYDYRVPELLAERTDDDRVEPFVDEVERTIGSGGESGAATGAD